MEISVVIPTCNRKESLVRVLRCLSQSSYPISEIIIIDSSDVKLNPEELSVLNNLKIIYLTSKRSVCIQRNTGIRHAASEWIFLCDDDLEVPTDYLKKLVDHVKFHDGVGAVSGLFLQKEKGDWVWQYPVVSTLQLVWRFIFQLSIWGQINTDNNFLTRKIKGFYAKKENSVSKAGWPVITEVSGEYFVTTVYSLGASLVKKEWLLASPFDEILSSHGIGDNYGVALGFPQRLHVTKNAKVYHHREPINRLTRTDQYFQRIMALHYFLKTKPTLIKASQGWLVWSLLGNTLAFIACGEFQLVKVTLHAITNVITGRNKLLTGYKESA